MSQSVIDVIDETADILGEEVRRIREFRGLTRQQLSDRLYNELRVVVSQQSLATYELGTRNMTVQRLVEICHVLRVRPATLMSKVDAHLVELPNEVKIDLRTVAQCNRDELHPAREWARTVLVRRKGDRKIKEVMILKPGALISLAELCGMSQREIINALRNA